MTSLAIMPVLACLLAGVANGSEPRIPETQPFELAGPALPEELAPHNVDVEPVTHDGRPALRVAFRKVDWPNVMFRAPDGAWDWSGYYRIAVDVFNPEAESVPVCMRVDNAGADGYNHCITATASARPGVWTTLQADINTVDADLFWGMRGIPVYGPVASGGGIDPARITAFQVFLPRPVREHTLYLGNIRLVERVADLREAVPFPFIDRFGQYQHEDWPGKLRDEGEFAPRRAAEEADLQRAPALPGFDRYGGWADGPQLEATGWFRTENVDGVWWLVTPEGRLFFSTGMDCVGTWETTFVEKRESWFEWLPTREDPVFGSFLDFMEGAHSGADIIGGRGRTFSFYRANLRRKYGEQWPDLWRDAAYARLRSWGFNTIANWSQHDVMVNSPIPYVVSAGIPGDVRRLEEGHGYWSKMVDAYAPEFAERAEAAIAPMARAHADNPLCIGYFVDNEIAWDAVERGALAGPPDQPARIAFIQRLREQYDTLDALNAAWGTEAASWDALRVPAELNAACRADVDALVHRFALRYFETVKGILRKHAPNQLYLGCRFSTWSPPVVRAAAETADVVSFNLYQRAIPAEQWSGENDIGAPIIIGEFHFGALDRGMFHTGLVPTQNQAERAESYARYVRSVAECPAFVGCHWFQYVDEPTTGRWFDGENYNIGFVTVVDAPYPEMVDAARGIHAEIYGIRAAR